LSLSELLVGRFSLWNAFRPFSGPDATSNVSASMTLLLLFSLPSPAVATRR
jgi:hypothetical protein